MFSKSLKFTTKVVLGLAVLSFFTGVFYVTPVAAHINDSHYQMTCFDNKVLISNYRDQDSLDFSELDFKTFTHFNLNKVFLPTVKQLPGYNLNSPPNKVALYIKHKTLIL